MTLSPNVKIGPFRGFTPRCRAHSAAVGGGKVMAKGEGMYVFELGSETQQQAILALHGKKVRVEMK